MGVDTVEIILVYGSFLQNDIQNWSIFVRVLNYLKEYLRSIGNFKLVSPLGGGLDFRYFSGSM